MKNVLQLDPSYANAQNMLGYILMENNDPEQAIKAVRKYIDLQPDVGKHLRLCL